MRQCPYHFNPQHEELFDLSFTLFLLCKPHISGLKTKVEKSYYQNNIQKCNIQIKGNIFGWMLLNGALYN